MAFFSTSLGEDTATFIPHSPDEAGILSTLATIMG
jgi:hypothetical protein